MIEEQKSPSHRQEVGIFSTGGQSLSPLLHDPGRVPLPGIWPSAPRQIRAGESDFTVVSYYYYRALMYNNTAYHFNPPPSLSLTHNTDLGLLCVSLAQGLGQW